MRLVRIACMLSTWSILDGREMSLSLSYGHQKILLVERVDRVSRCPSIDFEVDR